MKITQIDYSILGLLRSNSLSGYAIRKVFETTALGNFSSSPGTIYPALKRLEKQKLILKRTENNLFNATPKGIRALDEWIFQPVTRAVISKNPNELLLRFAFMDNTVPKNKKKFLESYKKELVGYIDELKKFHSEESATMPLNGRLAFEHGIQSYKATLKWVESVLITLD